jgi:hypothetical protein
MALPDFRINPYVSTPVGGLSQEFGQVAAQRIQDYDTNLATVDIWADQNAKLKQSVAPFIRDQAYADEIMAKTKGQIDQLAASGDYENATRQIKKGATQFANDIQPLIQNQQKFAAYSTELDELRKAGKVGYDTIQKAKTYSTKGYQGIDPGNPQGSMFNGFVPTEDISIADKVNKFIEGWKADSGPARDPKTGKPIGLTISADGLTYTRPTWEGANEKHIEAAIRQFLEGDTEFKTYRDTQSVIGNSNRVETEKENAIAAAKSKAGYSKVDTNEAFTPEHVAKQKQAKDMLVAIPPHAGVGAPNKNAVNKYDVLGLEKDKKTGRLLPSAYIERGADGKLYKYVNKEGKTISKQAYAEAALADVTPSSLTFNPVGMKAGFGPKERGWNVVETTQEEVDGMAKIGNESHERFAAEMWYNRLLNDPAASGILSSALIESQKSSAAKSAFLELNKSLYTTPEFLSEAYDSYGRAMKNSARMATNLTFNVEDVPNSIPPQPTSIADDTNLSNINGKPVSILGNYPEFTDFQLEGGTVDLNGIIDKIGEVYPGYHYVGMRKKGPMLKNPASNGKGSIQYEMMLGAEKTGLPKMVPLAVTVDDAHLEILNRVSSLAAIGENAQVPFYFPAAKLGPGGAPVPIEGSFEVKSSPVIDEYGQEVFHNTIDMLDKNGVKIQDYVVPQNMSKEQFMQYLQAILAPDFVSRHTKPK